MTNRSPRKEFKLVCPECSAVIITPRPEALIWERCPGCKRHSWDEYDLMMVEKVTPHASDYLRDQHHMGQ